MKSASQQSNDSTPDLPLGWTRVKRRTQSKTSDPLKNPPHEECLDPLCCVPSQVEHEQPSNLHLVTGTAIFCLPDPDCNWFQGYLISDEKQQSYGLLCIANDERVDACLKCDDYRLLDIQINDFFLEKKHSYTDVICRGGDAMKWNHRHISFDTTSMHTGQRAFDHVKRYFGSLLQKLGDDVVEEVMPAVAVTKGPLQFWIPNEKTETYA